MPKKWVSPVGEEKVKEQEKATRVRRYNQNKTWTRREEEMIKKLRAEGVVWRKIASKLSRSKIAVTQHFKVVKLREAAEKAIKAQEREENNRER